MKTLALLLVMVATAAASDFKEFATVKGTKTVEGRIIDANPDQVGLELRDGRVVVVERDRLTLYANNHVRNWLLERGDPLVKFLEEATRDERLEKIKKHAKLRVAKAKEFSYYTPSGVYLGNRPKYANSAPPANAGWMMGRLQTMNTLAGGQMTRGMPVNHSSLASRPPLEYNGPVTVKAHYKKDGTFVRGHTRRRPN